MFSFYVRCWTHRNRNVLFLVTSIEFPLKSNHRMCLVLMSREQHIVLWAICNRFTIVAVNLDVAILWRRRWKDSKLQTFSRAIVRTREYNIDKIVVINHQTEKTFAYFLYTQREQRERERVEMGKYIESENSAWVVFNRFRWDPEFVYFHSCPSSRRKTIFIIVEVIHIMLVVVAPHLSLLLLLFETFNISLHARRAAEQYSNKFVVYHRYLT